MSTPNELVSALQRARKAILVNRGASELVNIWLIENGQTPSNFAILFCDQEIAAIDATLQEWYDAE